MEADAKGDHRVYLGGTARSPDDAAALFRMGLDFAEIPVKDPETFQNSLPAYEAVMRRSRPCCLCHGPQEGDLGPEWYGNRAWRAIPTTWAPWKPFTCLSS